MDINANESIVVGTRDEIIDDLPFDVCNRPRMQKAFERQPKTKTLIFWYQKAEEQYGDETNLDDWNFISKEDALGLIKDTVNELEQVKEAIERIN